MNVECSYDNNGNLTSITPLDGGTVSYVFDGAMPSSLASNRSSAIAYVDNNNDSKPDVMTRTVTRASEWGQVLNVECSYDNWKSKSMGSITGNFISSNYLLSRIGYTPLRTVKLLGDALYENRLVRDSIFVQTGRRFLRRDITSDYAQYQYLMDNALAAREELQLIPGVALTTAQIAALRSDIVWIEEREVEGHRVLVPVVYISDTYEYRIKGGKIIAGDDVNLLVDRLENSGLLEAGNNLTLQANDSITNQKGAIRADNDVLDRWGQTRLILIFQINFVIIG